jgi:hypothetical protein
VYFTSILGFSHDLQGFQGPRNFTTNLAALVYLQRLLFLGQAIPARGYEGLSIPARSRYDRLARLQTVRRKYLVLGCESPFEEICTLMCYGRKAAENQTPATIMHWSEDGETVSISDICTVKMSELRALPSYLIEEAGRLCRELLFGMRPDCCLSRVKDSFTDTRAGSSFVNNPDNSIRVVYSKLRVAVEQGPGQRSEGEEAARTPFRSHASHWRRNTARTRTQPQVVRRSNMTILFASMLSIYSASLFWDI